MGLIDIGEGTKLHVETYGEGDPLLLVAGLGGTGKFWHRQIDVLAQRYTVILHDHRGVGQSPPAPLISGAEAMADDVIALMDALNVEKAHLVGHSTGGAIGQHIALKQPDRLKSLVLSASWPGPTPLFVDTFKSRRALLINCGPQHYFMIGTLLAVPASKLQGQFQGAEAFFKTRMQDYPGLEVELARLNAVMTHDLRHRLHEIHVPTAVICARDDQLTPPTLSEELASLIPNAYLQILDEGGHFCPQTNTDTYNNLLLSVLGRNS